MHAAFEASLKLESEMNVEQQSLRQSRRRSLKLETGDLLMQRVHLGERKAAHERAALLFLAQNGRADETQARADVTCRGRAKCNASSCRRCRQTIAPPAEFPHVRASSTLFDAPIGRPASSILLMVARRFPRG